MILGGTNWPVMFIGVTIVIHSAEVNEALFFMTDNLSYLALNHCKPLFINVIYAMQSIAILSLIDTSKCFAALK